MKIIFVTDTLHPGGSERVMSLLANALVKRGNEVEIFCLRGQDSFYSLCGVKTFFVEKEKTRFSLLSKAFILRNHICQEKPDVVIAFMTAVYCFSLLALYGTGFKIITSERIDPRNSTWWRKTIRYAILPLTNYHVVQTEHIKSYFSKSIQEKCTVIFNPVVETAFERNDVPPKKRFINVARLSAQKDQKMLIDAFEIVHDKYQDFSLSIYGEGPLEKELKDYIKKKGLDQSVFIEGTSNKIIDEMNSSFAFCLSSLYEGMSNAMLEALCVGLPIITTRVSGVAEIIEENINGYVTPIHDSFSFAEAMIRLIEEPDVRQQISQNNLAKGIRLFSAESVTNRWLEVVNNVIV